MEYLGSDPAQTLFASIRYKGGRITKLSPGPALASKQNQDRLVDHVREAAAPIHGSIVSSRVLFSERPLKGAFGWNDRLRISPCSPRARIGKGLDWFTRVGLPGATGAHLGPPYPFVVEVRTYRSPVGTLETNRALRSLDAFQHLLTLLIQGHLRYAHFPTDRRWTSIQRRNTIEYHLLHPGFDAGVQGRSPTFAKRRLKPASIHAGPDYYDRLWGGDKELLLPASLSDDLNTYQALPVEAARRFNRACYWYSLGLQFASELSISTVALATAIECLLPRSTAPACGSCGKPLGPGPTKLFNEHIKRYGTVSPELESRRNAIYAARSALVHGSHVHRADEDFFSPASDRFDRLLIEMVAQRSLLGWLRDPHRTF